MFLGFNNFLILLETTSDFHSLFLFVRWTVCPFRFYFFLSLSLFHAFFSVGHVFGNRSHNPCDDTECVMYTVSYACIQQMPLILSCSSALLSWAVFILDIIPWMVCYRLPLKSFLFLFINVGVVVGREWVTPKAHTL